MSARVMRYTVVVRHPETDFPVALLGGAPVPVWAKDLIHDEDLVSAGADHGSDPAPAALAAIDPPPPVIPDPGDPTTGDGSKGDDGNADGDKPPTDPETSLDYAKAKKPDLEAEVAKRNDGRDDDDKVAVEGKGTVADLVAALQADDVAQADTAN